MNDAERLAKLNSLHARAQQPDADVAKLHAELLNEFAAELWPEALRPLRYEIEGFPGGVEYYEHPPIKSFHSGYMPERDVRYRERPGRIVVSRADGSRQPVRNEIGTHKQFFISAPLERIQDFAKQPGDEIALELPELTQLIGEEEGGAILMQCPRAHVEEIVDVARQGLVAVLYWMIHPEKRDEMRDYITSKREQRGQI